MNNSIRVFVTGLVFLAIAIGYGALASDRIMPAYDVLDYILGSLAGLGIGMMLAAAVAKSEGAIGDAHNRHVSWLMPFD